MCPGVRDAESPCEPPPECVGEKLPCPKVTVDKNGCPLINPKKVLSNIKLLGTWNSVQIYLPEAQVQERRTSLRRRMGHGGMQEAYNLHEASSCHPQYHSEGLSAKVMHKEISGKVGT